MKAYNKPEFYVEEFRVNDVVAASCNSVLSGEEWKYGPQTVQCLVSQRDVIFSAGMTDCEHQINLKNGGGTSYEYETGDSWFFLNHTEDSNCGTDQNTDDNLCGKGAEYSLYYFWQGKSGKPSGSGDSGMSLLKHLLSLVGINDVNAGNGNVWHGGKATATLTQLYTQSF